MLFLLLLFLLVIEFAITLKLNQLVSAYPKVVIIGAGPAGLTSALTLQRLGWKNIRVLEKRTKKSFEISRSYNYLIDGRGQKILNYLNITHYLSDYGVPFTNVTQLTEVQPNGKIRQQTIPVMGIPSVERFFILRNVFLDMLMNEINNENEKLASDVDKIAVIYDCPVSSIEKLDSGKLAVKMETSVNSNNPNYITADIILGCDGINSGNDDTSICAANDVITLSHSLS